MQRGLGVVVPVQGVQERRADADRVDEGLSSPDVGPLQGAEGPPGRGGGEVSDPGGGVGERLQRSVHHAEGLRGVRLPLEQSQQVQAPQPDRGVRDVEGLGHGREPVVGTVQGVQGAGADLEAARLARIQRQGALGVLQGPVRRTRLLQQGGEGVVEVVLERTDGRGRAPQAGLEVLERCGRVAGARPRRSAQPQAHGVVGHTSQDGPGQLDDGVEPGVVVCDGDEVGHLLQILGGGGGEHGREGVLRHVGTIQGVQGADADTGQRQQGIGPGAQGGILCAGHLGPSEGGLRHGDGRGRTGDTGEGLQETVRQLEGRGVAPRLVEEEQE